LSFLGDVNELSDLFVVCSKRVQEWIIGSLFRDCIHDRRQDTRDAWLCCFNTVLEQVLVKNVSDQLNNGLDLIIGDTLVKSRSPAVSPERVVGIWEKNNNVVSCSPFHVAQSLDHRVIPEDERGVSTVEFNMEAACFLQARVGHVEVALVGKVALRVRRRLLVNCVQVTRLLVVFVFRLKITIQITEDFIGHVVAALWHTSLKRMGWCTAGHWIEEIVGLYIVREHVAEVVNPQPLDISTL